MSYIENHLLVTLNVSLPNPLLQLIQQYWFINPSSLDELQKSALTNYVGNRCYKKRHIKQLAYGWESINDFDCIDCNPIMLCSMAIKETDICTKRQEACWLCTDQHCKHGFSQSYNRGICNSCVFKLRNFVNKNLQ